MFFEKSSLDQWKHAAGLSHHQEIYIYCHRLLERIVFTLLKYLCRYIYIYRAWRGLFRTILGGRFSFWRVHIVSVYTHCVCVYKYKHKSWCERTPSSFPADTIRRGIESRGDSTSLKAYWRSVPFHATLLLQTSDCCCYVCILAVAETVTMTTTATFLLCLAMKRFCDKCISMARCYRFLPFRTHTSFFFSSLLCLRS